ncbi:MAG: nitrophenyl compound nitroreductase subunit ArsF family protein [Thermoguttaceae bacterium]
MIPSSHTVSGIVSPDENCGVDRMIVYSTHAKVRCPSCIKMEKLTRKTLDTFFTDQQAANDVEWKELDYEAPENAAFAERHKIATATVLLVRIKDGKEVESKNCAVDAWKLLGDEEQFVDTFRTHIERFLAAENTALPKSESEEFIFD